MILYLRTFFMLRSNAKIFEHYNLIGFVDPIKVRKEYVDSFGDVKIGFVI